MAQDIAGSEQIATSAVLAGYAEALVGTFDADRAAYLYGKNYLAQFQT